VAGTAATAGDVIGRVAELEAVDHADDDLSVP